MHVVAIELKWYVNILFNKKLLNKEMPSEQCIEGVAFECYRDILCPRLGAEWIGRISWLPRAPLGPIFMTGLPER